MDSELLQTSDVQPGPETVAAIATPFGEGGIGIVHVTGPEAVDVVSRMFQPKRPLDLRQQSGHTVHYGHIYDGADRVDEVLVRVCRRHESFTGAELVEINCHGGTVSVHRVVRCPQQHGVKNVPAADLLEEAVRNGRVDAVQREAIVELLRARSSDAVAMLLDQQRGLLSNELREVEQALSRLAWHSHRARRRAAVEAVTILHRQCVARLRKLAESWGVGSRLCRPTRVVIAGRANAGKSTLFNALCRQDRAITSEQRGTTRDFVAHQIVLGGFPLELIDTAGIRESLDLIEAESVRTSWVQISSAQLILLVLDGALPVSQTDSELARRLTGSSVIAIINKADYPVRDDVRQLAGSLEQPAIEVSALHGDGIDAVRQALVGACSSSGTYGLASPTLFTERQASLAKLALDAISEEGTLTNTAERRRALAHSAKAAADVLLRCRKD